MAFVERELKMTNGPRKGESLPLVLLVVDDAHKTSALELALKRENFATEVVTTIAAAVNAMSSRGPQVVITESNDSANLIPLVRTFGTVDSVSIIVLTNDMSAEKIGAFGGEIVVEHKTAARDVAQLARIEMMCRSAQQLDFGMHGARPEWVLRAMLSSGRSGRLILEHGAEIWFDQTNVVAVKMGTVTTVDSMAHALVLSERCALKLETIFESEGRVASQKEFAELVMPRVMRFRNALSHAVSLDARLGVDFQKLATALKTMPDDVNRVVRLFDGHRLMRNVIVDSPFDESLTLEIATRLAERGIVTPVEKPQGLHTEAPKLFEPGASKTNIIDSRPSVQNAAVMTSEYSAPVSVTAHKLEAIDPVVERQLQAFNMKAVVEQTAPESPRTVRQFAEGEQGYEEHAVDSAFHSAAESNVFGGATEFERAITPIMTPQVNMLAQSEVKLASISAQITAPQRHSVDLLEKRFFDDAILEALPEGATSKAKTPGSSGTRWSVYAACALAVLLIAVLAERILVGPEEKPAAPVVAILEPLSEMKVVPIEEPVFIQETSTDIDAQIAAARGLYEQGDYPSAIYQLEQVVKSDPNATQGWMLLGLARYDANDNSGAREAADRVMTLDPKNARAHLLDATLQFDSKNKVKAHAALEKYLQLDPNGQFAAEADALLKR